MSARDEISHARPGARSTLWVDVALSVGLAVFITIGSYFASQGQPERRPFDAGAVAILLISAGALTARRRHPVATLAVVFVATFVYLGLGYAQGPVWIPLIVAYFSAVISGKGIVAAVFAVAGFLLFPWLDRLLRERPAPSLGGLVALAAWLLVLLGAAEFIRIRRERAAEALRVHEEETRARATEERLRIARELHDALGHHLSLISVQAGVALHVNEELPEPVRGSLAAIKQSSGEALTELRSVLEILRQEGERAPRSPTSSLDRIDDLVTQAAAAGIEVRTETDGDVHPLPFGVDVAAFRIVQEALTNVARHAGQATATVRLGYADEDLTVEIDDDGDGASPAATPGSGKGVVGMRERAAALGGELEAGPKPGGGFRVRATLPLEGAR
jgi:signal transduction histidine kinase